MKKRLISLLLATCLIISIVLLPTVCWTSDSHVCSFDGAWTADALHHWHECSCGKTDEKIPHGSGTATADAKPICSVCGEHYGMETDGGSVAALSIEEFNESFDSPTLSSAVVQVSGVVYAGDNYGVYITNGKGTLYVKFDHSAGELPVGRLITATGYANLYYSLPQLMATSVVTTDGSAECKITPKTSTVRQIISENIQQKAKVKNHPVYRVSGTLTRDGGSYYLVDGTYKLQFKPSSYTGDYDALGAYVDKEIGISIVLSDCFTTTGIFRVSPLPDLSADIETDGDVSADSNTTDVNFIMINDTHGAFTDSDAGYSIGRVDTLVEALERSKGDYVFIHNGDAFQGSYVCGETHGLAMIEALNASELDCFVLGNHEFDWGLDKIAAYADGNLENGEASFPFLGANIYYKGTTTRPDWIDAYAIVEQDGLKIGVIGIMGDDQESSILTRYVKDYDFVNPVSIVETTSAYLRDTEGCDVVVVAAHDYTPYINQSLASLSGSGRIDAIFCAHTHENISEAITRSDSVTIPVVQCNHKNNNAQEVIISIGKDGSYESFSARKYYPKDYAISSDVQAIIERYRDLINEANEIIGTTDGYLSKQMLGELAVDAMLNDAYAAYDFGDVDVAIMNTGGIRATINAGDITRAEVFEVFPFNNSVVLVNISGARLKDLCRSNSSYLYIDVDDSIGSYSALNDNAVYQLAVIDYVFENTRYSQFNGLSTDDYIETTVILRELLMVYLDKTY